ncbi:MAG: hypothetical protein ABJC74_16890 [Gemmatimonadota bacterium]
MTLPEQLGWLLLLAVPVACVAWTVTHEELFREPREWLAAKSKAASSWPARKLFYMPTCEYCLSHYIALVAVLGTGFHLLLSDWRGSVLAIFGVVWVANIYMSAFVRLRLEIKIERTEAEILKARTDDSQAIESRHPQAAKVRVLSVPNRDAH